MNLRRGLLRLAIVFWGAGVLAAAALGVWLGGYPLRKTNPDDTARPPHLSLDLCAGGHWSDGKGNSLQVLEKDGIIFSSVPEQVRRELDQDRSGIDIALELYQRFREAGLNNIYLVPPIRRGGARNYAAAQEVLDGAAR